MVGVLVVCSLGFCVFGVAWVFSLVLALPPQMPPSTVPTEVSNAVSNVVCIELVRWQVSRVLLVAGCCELAAVGAGTLLVQQRATAAVVAASIVVAAAAILVAATLPQHTEWCCSWSM